MINNQEKDINNIELNLSVFDLLNVTTISRELLKQEIYDPYTTSQIMKILHNFHDFYNDLGNLIYYIILQYKKNDKKSAINSYLIL